MTAIHQPSRQQPSRYSSRWLAASLCVVAAALVGCQSGRPASPVCPAGAHLGSFDRCRASRAPQHRIPFRPGVQTKVMQGYHGYRTHKKDLAFSVDFKCKPGTPVVASRAGRVWNIREDSNKGCDDPSCVEDGNYVILDHGDGTFSEYHHLQQFGALVEPGQKVCAGDAIGLCGNTGFSSGPHLHFAVSDIAHRTVPTRLPKTAQRDFSFVVPEKTYTSRNAMDATCREVRHSRLPRSAFAHQGITVDQTLPLVIEERRSLSLSGTYHGPHPKVAVHRRPVDGGEWVDECMEVDEAGNFSATLSWPKPDGQPDYYWFMVTAANKDCLAPGWAWSYKVRVD